MLVLHYSASSPSLYVERSGPEPQAAEAVSRLAPGQSLALALGAVPGTVGRDLVGSVRGNFVVALVAQMRLRRPSGGSSGVRSTRCRPDPCGRVAQGGRRMRCGGRGTYQRGRAPRSHPPRPQGRSPRDRDRSHCPRRPAISSIIGPSPRPPSADYRGSDRTA